MRLLVLLFLISGGVAYSQEYKRMMHDPTVNFYDACAAAEAYFATHGKGKGSGWKGYQRWKAENEPRFYPSGDRSNVDPHFASKAYAYFIQNNPVPKNLFPGGWRDLGPYDANNITSHYAPGIGRVEAFYVEPSNENHIYLGSRSGGFWYTTDGGSTWENSTDYMSATGVNAIAASPTHADSVLINLRNASNGASYGIYRSTDGGANWTQTLFNPGNLGWGGLGTNDQIYRIAYHPTIPGRVFIGCSNGLYRSDDDLQTWTHVFSNGQFTDINFHPTDPNKIYVYDTDGDYTTENALLISSDGGLTFVSGNDAVGNNNAGLYISTSPDCPNCVYVASSNGVWRSTDEGVNFTFLTNPSESCGGFAVSDVDTSYMVYGYVDLMATANGGQNFQQRTWWANGNPDTTYIHADMRWADCINGNFYVATDGYLAMSPDNGLTWVRISDGTGIRENYAMGVSQSNWEVSMSGSQDNGTSILLESGWVEWNGGDGMEAVIQPLNDSWMIGSWQYGTRNRTKDRGLTRHGVGTPQQGTWVAPMLMDPNHQMRIYHFSDSVFRSEEFGTGWTYRGTPGTGDIHRADIAENNSNIILVTRSGTLYKSYNGGETFGFLLGLPGYFIQDVAFDPNDDNTIIVVYARYQNDGQKVYVTHNGGGSWTNITHNLGNIPLRSVAIDHSDASNIYVGGEIGVYTMPMGGTAWTAYNANLPSVSVNDLEIQWGSNTIKAATWGRGLWEYHLVGRTNYPAILTTEITDPPTDIAPAVGNPQDVTSVISYANTLSSVYVAWSIDNPTYDSVIPMVNTMDSTWTTQWPIPTYPPGTDMYFKVYAVGASGDTTETYKFHYEIRPSCVSNGNMSWQTAVTLVDFESISRASGKTQPYTDYSETDTTIVQQGVVYPLNVHVNTDGNYTVHARVWIDWNQDYDFDDAGETYELGSAQNTADGPVSNVPMGITIPANAALGKTTMRVSARYNQVAGPCDTGYDGEVEDYALIVQPICYPTSDSVVAEACSTYISPEGNTYTSSGNYVDSLVTSFGCDSVIYTNLTIHNPTSSSMSVATCDSFSFNGQTLYSSGNYVFSLYDVFGCDSIVTLDLTITSASATVVQSGGVLETNAVGTYQWIDCQNGPIPGATGQQFIPSYNGQFAVVVTQNGCVDTSACIAYDVAGIINLQPGFFSLVPNPTDGQFTIHFGEVQGELSVEIRNELGQIVDQFSEVGVTEIEHELNEASGVYFVTVIANEYNRTVKLIVD